MLPGMRTAYLFFPLWLGYILVVDAWVLHRRGTSLWSRSRAGFAGLFLASAPVWWIFELINNRTGNWEYLGSNRFSAFEHYFYCTLSFSTVMPAVFETAELVRSFGWVEKFSKGPELPRSMGFRFLLFLLGCGMILLTLAWPRYCYPLVWTSIVLVLEPINAWLKRPSLLEQAGRGEWGAAISLAVGALVCGFFWEMWNFHSFPKWVYHTPGAEFAHVFEMPLLGYGGYLPFGLEIFALRNVLWRWRSPLNL
jgi:hypothetical protein